MGSEWLILSELGKQIQPILSSQEGGFWRCIRVPLGPVPSETLVTFPRRGHFPYAVALAAWGSQCDLCDCRKGAWEALCGSPRQGCVPSSVLTLLGVLPL